MRRINILLIALLILFPTFLTPASAEPPSPRTLERPLAPVIVAGAEVLGLTEAPLNQLFVYAYTGGGWSQIPWQFDEYHDGDLVASDNGVLDGGDELVLMAADAGDRAPEDSWIADADSRAHPRCEITISDPLDPAKQAWVYVYRSGTLSETVTEDYANYDAGQLLIAGQQYRLGLVPNRTIADRLELNNSGVDILDRSKLRLQMPFASLATEDSLDPVPLPTARRDGRVRAIIAVEAEDGSKPLYFIAYRSLFRYTVDLDISSYPFAPNYMRLSLDLNESATGSAYYGANNPTGATVDGSPDSVPPTPVSDWMQISGATGAFVQVADWTGSGGTARTYYKDDATVDNSDTGDKKSYGDAGILLNNPGKHIRATIWTCVLPPTPANVGESYRAGVLNPLQAEGAAQVYQPPVVLRYVHLPLILRNH